MRRASLFSSILALAATACAGRPDPGPPPPTRPTIIAAPVALMIEAMDRDGDLRVTRAEYDAGVRQSFESSAGGSESLSPIDLDRWAARWLGSSGALPGLLDFDGDGDNRVSRSEFIACFALIFDRYDANHDGVLDRSELLNVGQARFPGGERPGGEGRRGGEGRPPPR
jgi:hypothetical protein